MQLDETSDNVQGRPSEETLQAFRAAIAEQETGYPEDYAEVSLAAIETTRDPFASFGTTWAKKSTEHLGLLSTGEPFCYWREVQAMPGQRRVTVAIADCGDFRLIYQQ